MIGKIGLLILGILSLTIYCVAQISPYTVCPQEEKISPCICDKECDDCVGYITCSNITTTNELYEIMNKSGDFPFRAAIFRDTVISYIPALLFEKKQYRIIEMENCVLDAFINQPVTGDSPFFDLTMDNVIFMKGVTFEYFSYFKEFRFLSLKNMPVRKISKKLMEQLPLTMEDIRFDKTMTDKIGSHAFQRFESLTSLYVENGNLKTIEASMFPKTVIYLHFSNNKIKSIPPDFVSGLEGLSMLTIDNNLITTIDQAAFRNIPKYLTNVYLRDNPIQCQCDMKWVVGVKRPIFEGACQDRGGKKISDLVEKDFYVC